MLVKSSILEDIKSIIGKSKEKAIRAVDHERVLMYWPKLGGTQFVSSA